MIRKALLTLMASAVLVTTTVSMLVSGFLNNMGSSSTLYIEGHSHKVMSFFIVRPIGLTIKKV